MAYGLISAILETCRYRPVSVLKFAVVMDARGLVTIRSNEALENAARHGAITRNSFHIRHADIGSQASVL